MRERCPQDEEQGCNNLRSIEIMKLFVALRIEDMVTEIKVRINIGNICQDIRP